MRLIDADECIEQIKKYCVGCDNYKGIRCRACSFDDAMGVVDSMPTIDDAEIRRQTIEEVIGLLQEYKEFGMISYEEKHANAVIDRVVNRLEQMKGEAE